MDPLSKNIGEQSCFIGERLDKLECSTKFSKFSELDDSEKRIFAFVTKENEAVPGDTMICYFHKSLPSRARWKYCSDPFGNHTKGKAQKYYAITFPQAKKLRAKLKRGYPGDPLCRRCNAAVNKLPDCQEDSDSDLSTSPKRRKVEEQQSSEDEALEDEQGNRSPTSTKDEDPAEVLKTPEYFEGPSTSGTFASPDMFESPKPISPQGAKLCFLGYHLDKDCSQDLEYLQPHEKSALTTVQAEIPEDAVICGSHRRKYLSKLDRFYFKFCCDPFSAHGNRKSQAFADMLQIQKMKAEGHTLAFHAALCKECCARINKLPTPTQQSSSPGSQPPSQGQREKSDSSVGTGTPLSGVTAKEKSTIDLANILQTAGLAKLQPSGWHEKEKISAARKKYDEVKQKVKKLIRLSLDVNDSDVSDSEHTETVIEDVGFLVSNLKQKILSASSYEDKVKLLTLAPNSWSHERVAEEFGVSLYMARKARQLKNEKGILPNMDPRHGRPISSATEELVKNFFTDEEFSRECPGTKQQVKIGRDTYQAKRLLLANLGELYKAFKERYPEVKIGRSKGPGPPL